MFPEKAFMSSQVTATHGQKGKQEKTISHPSCVSHSLESSPPSTHHLLWWDFTTVTGYGGNTPDYRWDQVAGGVQHLPLTLSKEPSKGEVLREAIREACASL